MRTACTWTDKKQEDFNNSQFHYLFYNIRSWDDEKNVKFYYRNNSRFLLPWYISQYAIYLTLYNTEIFIYFWYAFTGTTL